MSDLKPVRAKIDAVDKMLFFLLIERIGLSQQVAEIKAASGQKTFDAKREAEILSKIKTWIAEEDLQAHEAKILELWNTMLDLSREVQDS